MDAHPKDDASDLPIRRHEFSGSPLSQEVFDTLMDGPRGQAQFFRESLLKQYPDNSSTANREPHEQQDDRSVRGELLRYEKQWLKQHLASTQDDYYALLRSSPESIPQQSELSFHIINQSILPQWHRLLVSSQSPKMSTLDLKTAQISLAIESAKMLVVQEGIERSTALTHQLTDIDAMIQLLQLTIDSELHNQPNLIAVPYPKTNTEARQPDFLVFTRNDNQSYKRIDIQKSDILDARATPGASAIELLTNLRISTIARRPEFQNKTAFRALLLARESIRPFEAQLAEYEISLDDARDNIGRWVVEYVEKNTDPNR